MDGAAGARGDPIVVRVSSIARLLFRTTCIVVVEASIRRIPGHAHHFAMRDYLSSYRIERYVGLGSRAPSGHHAVLGTAGERLSHHHASCSEFGRTADAVP